MQKRDPDKETGTSPKKGLPGSQGPGAHHVQESLQELCFFSLEKIKNESTCSLSKTEGGTTRKTDSSQRYTAEGQEAIDMSCSKENSCWIKNFTM